MADTGWVYSGTVGTAATGDASWTNTANVPGSNTGTYAAVTLGNGDVSDTLNLTNFDLSGIPSDATIDGIEVAIYRQRSEAASQVRDLTVRMIIEGTASGTDLGTGGLVSTTAGEVTYGGATNLWGLTPTVAQLQASTSGVTLIFENTSGTGDARVMYVGIKVYFTHAATGWWDLNWSHMIEGTIDATYVDEAIPVVPVWIPSSATAWFSAVDAAGDDIRVFNSDDTVALDYYIVDIDTAAPHCMLLVNVSPIIDTVTDAPLRIYAGNASASAVSSSSAVFTSTNYAAYYLPGMTTTDLTGGGYDLTAVNSPGTAASQWDGLTAASYNGSNQYHGFSGTPPVSDVPATLWGLGYATNSTTSNTLISIGWSGSAAANQMRIRFAGAASGDPIQADFNGSANQSPAVTSTGYSVNTWHSADGSRDADAGTTTAYIDGGSAGTDTTTLSGYGTVDRFAIGVLSDSSPNHYFGGRIAAAAVSSVVRSANFVATNYDAWFTADFITWGSVETAPTGGVAGDGAITLTAFTASGSGSVLVAGDGAISLPALTLSGTGSVLVSGDGALTFPAVTLSGSGAVPVAGDGDISLPGLTLSGDGSVLVSGDAALTLPAITLAGTSGTTNNGNGDITLPSFLVSGSGAVSITGSGALELPAFEMNGTFSLTASTDWYRPHAAVASHYWQDTQNILDEDDFSYAYYDVVSGSSTGSLWVTDFRPVFPPGVDLTGIEFRVRVGILADPTTKVRDNLITIVPIQSPYVDKSKAFDWYWGVYEMRYYGGQNDLWGTTFGTSDVEDAGFGIFIAANNVGPPRRIRIFSVEARFWYSPKTVIEASLSLPALRVNSYFDNSDCICCAGFTMANLLEMRKMLVKRSGHYELVTDYEADDWSDNGADEFIRAAQRRLDDLFQYHKSEAWLYHKLSAGQSLVSFQNSRIVKEVWISKGGHRTRLRRLGLREMRDLFSSVPLDAETPGDPVYWCSGVTMLAPSQLEETAETFADGGLTDYDLIVFGEDYPNKAIYVMPPADADTTVEVLAEWYSKELCEDADVSFWSQYPELLVRAARSEIEVDQHRNSQGRKDFDEPLLERLQKLHHNLIAEEASGPPGDFVMKG